MAVQPTLGLTVEEYLPWEESNFEKHEYIDGEVRLMTGATNKHNRIMMNLAIAIGRQLDDSNCFLLSSEMRTKVGATRYVYPDLCAVCGEESLEAHGMVLLNPVLVIEVTSPSSLRYDRGDKRDFYFDAPSIQAYLIIDQQRIYADLNLRAGGGWQGQAFNSLEAVIPLSILNCELALAAVYRGITFDGQPD